jgi:phosphatidylinositol alpha-mannosyltransferase
MRSLKIGIVTQSYYPFYGGVTEHVHHVALALERQGHAVTLITGGSGRDVPHSPLRVLRTGRTVLVPSNGARATVTLGFGLRRWLRRVLRAENFDLINCQCALAPTLPLFAIKEAACPVVGTFHSSAKSNIGYAIFRRTLRTYHARLAGKIAVSEPARDFVREYFGGDYKIIPNGVDTERFSPRERPLERFDDGAFNVLYVGRLEPRKGLSVLLNSFRGLWESEGERARLIIVGDGPLRRRLSQSVPDELRAAVHFEGRVSSELLPRYYASSRVLCSPATRSESFGIVLLEAMASGVPVIASDIPGYRTAVKNGVHGLLVEPGAPGALATALCLLARDESLRARMAAAGRSNAAQYSWDRVASMIEDYFWEVLEDRGRHRAADRAAPVTRPAAAGAREARIDGMPV